MSNGSTFLQFRRLQPVIGSSRTNNARAVREITLNSSRDLIRVPEGPRYNITTNASSKWTIHHEFKTFRSNTVHRRMRYRFIESNHHTMPMELDIPVTYSNVRKQSSIYPRPKAPLSLQHLPALNSCSV